MALIVVDNGIYAIIRWPRFTTQTGYMEIDRDIGRRIATIRQMKRVSRGALAEALGVSVEQVRNYEKGRHHISASRLVRISQVCKVPVAVFFAKDDHPYFRFDQLPRKLSSAFLRIGDPGLQKLAVRIMEAIAYASRQLPHEAEGKGSHGG